MVAILREEINIKELATKKDIELSESRLELKIEKEIAQLRYDSLKFVVWTGVGVVPFLGGMIAHGFGWI